MTMPVKITAGRNRLVVDWTVRGNVRIEVNQSENGEQWRVAAAHLTPDEARELAGTLRNAAGMAATYTQENKS